MSRVQARRSGMGSRRRLARDRENGMRSVGRLTRLALVASVGLAAVFSALADVAFPGRSVQSAGEQSARSAVAGDPFVRVALPPPNGGDTLTPPAAPPQPAVGGGSVATSGGS